MKWKIPKGSNRFYEKHNWHDWFAWRPVSIGDKIAWLEVVRRKGFHESKYLSNYWIYEYEEKTT